jgi:predicted DNA-binding transcriptional regulator YafY
LRALAKLEQVLPTRLRRRINTLQSYTIPVPPAPDRAESRVSAETLTTITAACRDHERLRFDYRSHDGAVSRRDVEPYRLVNWGRRWYLVAWDTERGDWRTFRADRVEPRVPTGPRFAPRALPDEDVAAYVARRVTAAPQRYRARITVHAPADVVAQRLPPALGPVEAIDEDTCAVLLGSDDAEMLAAWIGALGQDFEFDLDEAPELAEQLLIIADRYYSAAGRAARPAAPGPAH